MAAHSESTVVASARRWAEHAPERPIFTWLGEAESEPRTLNAAELYRRVGAVAGALVELNARGERVLLLLAPGLDFIVGFLACLQAGAIAVPAAAPRRSSDVSRCKDILRHCAARFAIVDESTRRQWGAELRDSTDASWLDLGELQHAGARPPAELPRPSDVAFLQYTSGSTGRPRGVIVTHENLTHNSKAILALRGDHQCVGANWLPPYHDMGLIGGVVHPVHSGIHSVLMSPHHFLQRPVRWLEAVTRYRATVSAAPDFALRLCAERVSDEQKASLDLSSWRMLICGAEPVRHSTWLEFVRRFCDVGLDPRVLSPCYGLAESTLLVSGCRWNEEAPFKPVDRAELEQGRVKAPAENECIVTGCGRPGLGQKVLIANERLEPVAGAEIGEIVVAGPSVAAGYYADPEATAQCFGVTLSDGSGPWMRTGDLGFVSDGQLFVVGRLKELIKIRGRNLYATDIEQAARAAHPAVQPAGVAAFSVERAAGEELVVLVEIERQARHLPAGEILSAVRQAVGRVHGVNPGGLALLLPSKLPRTTSGKLRRLECRRQWLAGSLEVVAEERSAP